MCLLSGSTRGHRFDAAMQEGTPASLFLSHRESQRNSLTHWFATLTNLPDHSDVTF